MASSTPSPPPSPSSTAAAGGGSGGGGASIAAAGRIPAAPASRRPPPPCWAHDETLALIDSYRDKWYSLRRGNLRASHWQEVADSVARRSLSLPGSTPKTSVQCRHKVEKLRKRYRAERQRSLSRDPSAPPSSSWVYFRKMESMDHAAPARSSSSSDADPSSSDDPGSRSAAGGSGTPTRSLHCLMANGRGNGSKAPIATGELRFTIPKAVRSKIVDRPVNPNPNPNPGGRFFKGYGGMRTAAEEMRRRLEQKRRREREGEVDAVGEMVSALQMLGDRFMRMEHTKMEMAREMEKVRMEMELKRTEMVLESQRRVVDAFVKGAVGSKKRANVDPEN